MKRVTARDVAKLAGVSPTTVSLVLNDHFNVSLSPETRERVRRAAREIGYEPRPQGGASTRRSEALIGVVVPTLANWIYPTWVQEIGEYAETQGYRIVVCNTMREPQNEVQFLRALLEMQVSGIIVVFNPDNQEYAQYVARQIPFVRIADSVDELAVDTIDMDSMKAARLVADHLLDLGHSRLAYLSTPLSKIAASRYRRLDGIRSTIDERGGVVDLLVRESEAEREQTGGAFEFQTGYDLTTRLLDEEAPITAIVGVNDMVAIGALTAARDRGIVVPDALSVVGFDNVLFSSVVRPSLTTVDHHTRHRARQAIDRLIDAMGATPEPAAPIHIRYGPQLIVRHSSGPAPS